MLLVAPADCRLCCIGGGKTNDGDSITIERERCNRKGGAKIVLNNNIIRSMMRSRTNKRIAVHLYASFHRRALPA